MVPRAVHDVGYTAIGLGVLALQHVQTRRREVTGIIGRELDAAGRQARAVVAGVQAKVEPVTDCLGRLPRLLHPVGAAIDDGRSRIVRTLRRTR